MSRRLSPPSLLALVVALCFATGPAKAFDEFLFHQVNQPGDDISGTGDGEDRPQAIDGLPVEDERKVSAASKRPVRGLKSRASLRIVRSEAVRSEVIRSRPSRPVAPDGTLLCWRRHQNGQLAAIISHKDGLLTAKLWPETETFVTGLTDLAQAQHQADGLAHADGNCALCRSWQFS